MAKAKTTTKKSPTKARSKTTTAPKKKPTTSAKKKASAKVTVDRRTKASERRAKTTDRRQKQEPVAVEQRTLQRREKVTRRRQIDPTTCERDYTGEEVEFMRALDEYKRKNGRMFPTCSELLEVIRALGYEKRVDAAGASIVTLPKEETSPTAAKPAAELEDGSEDDVELALIGANADTDETDTDEDEF